MEEEQGYLLALKGKNGEVTILEFENETFLRGKEEAALQLGIWCRRLEVADLDDPEFQQARFFNMRDPVVCKIFFLEQWVHFFNTTEADSKVS